MWTAYDEVLAVGCWLVRLRRIHVFFNGRLFLLFASLAVHRLPTILSARERHRHGGFAYWPVSQATPAGLKHGAWRRGKR